MYFRNFIHDNTFINLGDIFMKIWNGYLKNWIDLNKCPVNKSTWYHGFFAGCCIMSIIIVFIYDFITLVLK